MDDFKRCTRCVMDNSSDPTITFDREGHCNYCTEALLQKDKVYFPGEEGQKKLQALLGKIKSEGVGKKYDCIMGLSGGLDSSYLAYLGYQWGLRILGVHIDDGFDTEISKRNIQKLSTAAHIDLITIHPDLEQFAALTKAYLKAGVPNLAAPQDNVLFAFLYDYMKKNGIHYFLSGGNFALECILQKGNSYSASDVTNIKDIFHKFGDGRSLKDLKFQSSFSRYFDQKFRRVESPRPLNYVDYRRDNAFRELAEFCGFEYYGSKHLENILTAFAQLYWFPKKFGVDKRTSHLSSMIVSGQMTRDQALLELEKPLYDPVMMEKYIRIIKEKLHISDSEFEEIMAAPCHQHTEFKTDWFSKARKILYKIKKRS